MVTTVIVEALEKAHRDLKTAVAAIAALGGDEDRQTRQTIQTLNTTIGQVYAALVLARAAET